jgi:uncharacterized protein (TIGR02246 family)
MTRLALLVLVAAATAQAFGGGAAEVGLTDASARAFVARQDAAWNARDAHAFAATFTPDAVFIDQAVGSDGKVIANGRSTLTQATLQSRRFFARTQFHETVVVDRVAIAPGARTAQVFAQTTTRLASPHTGRNGRTYCARTEQTLVLAHGRLLSRGQTDTDIRCAR